NANSVPNEGILTPKQAFMVDTKYDDGMPGLGTIVAPKNSAVGSCVTSDVAATATYVTTSNDAKNCIIIVKIQ
ncbi:MAG: hypothetical protein ACOYNL_07340, partial [Rickettsiales bacterium]